MLSTLHLQLISSLATHFHILNPSSSLFPIFSPCQAFKFVCAVQTPCAITSHPHPPISSIICILPCYVTLAFFAIGSSSHGISIFAHCLVATPIASDAICAGPLSGSPVGSSLSSYRICLDLSVLICFVTSPTTFPLTSVLSPILNCQPYLR